MDCYKSGGTNGVCDTSMDRQETAGAKAHVWDLQCKGSGTPSPCAICYDCDSQPVLKMFLCLRSFFFFVVIAVVVFWSGDLLFTHQNWKGGAKDHRNKNCNFVSVGFCFLLLCQEIFFFFLR